MRDDQLLVGIARADITPPVGIAHAGWGAQLHERASGIDHPMCAMVLWISDGETSIVICDLDLGVVSSQAASMLRKRISDALSVPAANIRVSYTHTHAGPLIAGEVKRIGAGQELVQAYTESVWGQVLGAARAARHLARPGRMAAGYGSSNVAVNRRLRTPDGRTVVGENPSGFSDEQVLVVRFDDSHGDPIAAVLGYAAHPITLAYQNDQISPDYPGFARAWHERLTGAPTLFLQGCAGDQMAERGLTGDRRIPRELGKRLAAAAAERFLQLQTSVSARTFSHVVESGAPLGLMRDETRPPQREPLGAIAEQISLPIREVQPLAVAQAEVEECLRRVEDMRAKGSDEDLAGAMFRAKRAEMRLGWSRWLDGCSEARVELQSLRIGDLALVGFPGEPFARIGTEVRSGSRFPVTHVGGYTNGWHGYVPTDDEFERGGYEVELGSTFSREAAQVLTDAALDHLDRLAEARA